MSYTSVYIVGYLQTLKKCRTMTRPKHSITATTEVNAVYFINVGELEIHTVLMQGWRQEFSDGGLNLPTRGLKYGFLGTINAKNLQKIAFHLPTEGLACSDGGL